MSKIKNNGSPNHVQIDHYGAIDKNVMADINTKLQGDPNIHPSVKASAQGYASGTDVHVGPGQDKHLAHEAWHVVQQ